MSVLDEIGGQAYLTNLVNKTPSAIHAEVYGEMVSRTSTRRKMLIAADTIRQKALDEELSIDNVINEAEQALFNVSNSQIKREFVPIWEAVSDYYDEIEKLLEMGAGTVGIPTGFKGPGRPAGRLPKVGPGGLRWAAGHGQDQLDPDGRHASGAARGARGHLHDGDGRGTDGAAPDVHGNRPFKIGKLRTANINPREQTRLTEAIGRISNFPLFIDDTPSITPIEMRTKCRRLQHEYGLDMVMVDYMQLMSAGKAYENNRVQEISYISRALKELARELNVCVLSTAQLSRAVEQRQDKRPQLSDLRESGSIEQDADAVMFLYRDEVYNPDTTEFPNQADSHALQASPWTHRQGRTLLRKVDYQIHGCQLSARRPEQSGMRPMEADRLTGLN